jgi:hypothetical protein
MILDAIKGHAMQQPEAIALLEWCDDTMKNCFCGFRFVMPVQLPSGTFLDDYLPEQPSPPQTP